MYKSVLILLAASTGVLASIADPGQAQARPAGGGGIGRVGGGWSGLGWSGAPHRGVGLHRGRFAPLSTGSEPGRYLSETASFLADSAAFPTDNERYPEIIGGPFGYTYPRPAVPASYRVEPMSYVVPVHRGRAGARRTVRVFRGAARPVSQPIFAPDMMP